MKRVAILLVVAALAGATAFADLVPYGPLQYTGTGFGKVPNVITATMPSSGTGYEAVCSDPTLVNYMDGCVIAADGQTLTSNDTGTKTDVPSINLGAYDKQNNPYGLGITDASQIVFIFNPSQTRKAITLDQMALTLWYDGVAIFTTVALIDMNITEVGGVGQSGFGFVLDSDQIAAANAAIALHNTDLGHVLIAGGFSAGCDSEHYAGCGYPADDGPDTLWVANRDAIQLVPEPGSFLLIGSGLLFLGYMVRRRLKVA